MAKDYTIKLPNYFGLNMDKVKEQFEGNPQYIGDMSIKNRNGTFATVAVFKVEKPNREKGHKDFLLIQLMSDGTKTSGVVYGMDLAQMKEHSKHKAVKCLDCKLVLYSVDRHHYHTCSCANKAMVDGGRDYLRCGALDRSRIEMGTLNLLTRTFYPSRKKPTLT